MIRSESEMAIRDSKCREIEDAFKAAKVDTRHARMPPLPYCEVSAWLNYGYGGQRRVVVTVHDDAVCRVYLSPMYDVPEDQTGEDVPPLTIPLLFELPLTTADIGDEIVRRVRDATFQD